MRKTYGALVLGLLVAACGGGEAEAPPPQAPPPPPVVAPPPPEPVAVTPPPAPPKPSMAELQTASLKAYQEAFADPKKVTALYADDASLWIAGMPEMKGKDAILQSEQANKDPQTNMKIGFGRSWTKGDMVVVEWVVNGTQAKEWNGIPATEKPWGVQGASILWFNQDGLITKDHRYFDIGTIMSQLGASKMKARPIPAIPSAIEAHVAKGDANEDKEVAWLKSVDTTFEKHDVKGFLEGVTDDTQYDDYTMPAPMKGKAPAKGFFEAFTKAFPDIKTDVTNAFAVEDYAIQEYAMNGTQKAALTMGPGMTIPATKKPINYHALDIMQVKDGKLVHGWTYANGVEFATQLGIMPPPGAKGDKGAKAGDKGAPAKPAPKAGADKAATPAAPPAKK